MPLATVVFAGLVWWQLWRSQTRNMRELCNAVSHSRLDPQTKAVLQTLAWSPRAWDSGLIKRVAGWQIVWSGKILDRKHGPRVVYLFDAFVRPVAEACFPLVCVVLDQQGDVVAWKEVATFSVGFMSAKLDDDVLTITTIANFFAGKGIYRYAIGDRSITAMDEEDRFVKFDDGEEERAGQRRKWLAPDPAIRDAMKQSEDRQDSL